MTHHWGTFPDSQTESCTPIGSCYYPLIVIVSLVIIKLILLLSFKHPKNTTPLGRSNTISTASFLISFLTEESLFQWGLPQLPCIKCQPSPLTLHMPFSASFSPLALTTNSKNVLFVLLIYLLLYIALIECKLHKGFFPFCSLLQAQKHCVKPCRY